MLLFITVFFVSVSPTLLCQKLASQVGNVIIDTPAVPTCGQGEGDLGSPNTAMRPQP